MISSYYMDDLLSIDWKCASHFYWFENCKQPLPTSLPPKKRKHSKTNGKIFADFLRKNEIKNKCFYFLFLQLEIERRNCGNKIVEDDEECDCGTSEECETDLCCDSITCKLKTEAQCAGGLCCDNCKVSLPISLFLHSFNKIDFIFISKIGKISLFFFSFVHVVLFAVIQMVTNVIYLSIAQVTAVNVQRMYSKRMEINAVKWKMLSVK